jgi:16S rRNA (uracil1498-N3)-methyltransferase
MSATPRLYVAPDLGEGADITLDADQSHYLTRVLRLGAGAPVRLFNGRDGEFEAELVNGTKAAAVLKLKGQMRQQHRVPDLWLMFSPLKKARTDFLVEKAVELGVAELRPTITERTDADVVRVDRLQRIAVEAAEQTERLDVPLVRDAEKLVGQLTSWNWNASRTLIYADEAGDDGEKPWGGDKGRAPAIADVVAELAGKPVAILIGPEGGFSQVERKRLRELPYVRPVSLGPRILRAETAAVAALTIYQSVAGDWKA